MKLSFGIRPENRYELLTLLMFVSLSLVEWIPNLLSPSTLVFATVMGFCLLLWLFDVVYSSSISKSEIVCILLLTSILLNNALVNATYGGSYSAWFRSGIFLILWYLFIFFLRFYNKIRLDFLISSFVFSSILWIIVQLLATSTSIFLVILTGARLTYFNANFILPYPLFAVLLSLLLLRSNIYKLILLVFLIIVIIAAGYKAHILLFAIALAYYILKEVRLKKLLMLVFLIPIALYFASTLDILTNFILDKLNTIGNDSDEFRIREWESAIDIFLNHPLFGAGLGKEFYTGIMEEGESSRPFIHNSILYLLSTLGIFNSLIIFIFFLKLFLLKGSNSVKLILIIMLASTLSAASYKLIHFNIMLMILSVILLKYNNYKQENLHGLINSIN